MTNSKFRSLTLSVLVWGIVFVIVPYFLKYAIFSVVGASYWSEHISVEPVKNSYAIGEDIIFKSTVDKKRPVFTEYSDTLYCNLDNSDSEFIYFSNYQSSAVSKNNEGIVVSDWRWGEDIPSTPATCYLKAGVVISPVKSVQKTSIIYSREFRIE